MQCGRPGFDRWVRKIPWRRAWQPTPVFLPGESHGQRILAGYSPWGRRESDPTERLTLCAPHRCVYSRVCLFLALLRLVRLFILAAPGLRGCRRALSRLRERTCSPRGWAGFSLRWLLLLQSTGSGSTDFSSCSSQAEPFRLAGFSSCILRVQLLRDMWNLPGPGIEPESPELTSRFPSTAPPGKSYLYFLNVTIRL